MLWCHALDCEGSEFCVLVPYCLSKLNEFGIGPPSLHFFHVVPDLNDHPLWGFAIDSSHRFCSSSASSSYCKLAAAHRFDDGLSFRGIFLCVGIRIGHIDFCNIVDQRRTLSVEALNSCGTERSTCEH